MINLVKGSRFVPNISTSNFGKKNDYTTKIIDIRSTVKDFSLSSSKNVVSNNSNHQNTLKRSF